MEIIGQDIITGMGFVGNEAGVLYSMAPPKAQATASGSPITISSASAPFTQLLVFGRSTQDGTPSPSSPVPIETAGQGGQIGVSVGGGNICPTSSGATNFYTECMVKEGIQYTICALQSKLTYFNIVIDKDGDNPEIINIYEYNAPSWKSEGYAIFTPSKSGEIFINSFADSQWTEIAIYPGTLTSRKYEPYVTPQSLILSTPNGLPGVPVDAYSEEYTYQDSSGQKWIADSVEMFADGTGELVQRTYQLKNVQCTSVNIREEVNQGVFELAYPSDGSIKLSISNMFANKNAPEVGTFTISEKNLYIRFPLETTLDEINSAIQDAIFIYPLATPITTPLSAEEVAAFKTLTTYEPTTVVQNDAGCWMTVGYYSYGGIQRLVNEAMQINGGK